ncbi:MAG: hypothetical protein S4CHLAM102_09850 [Chlamydiia bacterium]|nr:hypothetical protein [Chlamydiia bacterium]
MPTQLDTHPLTLDTYREHKNRVRLYEAAKKKPLADQVIQLLYFDLLGKKLNVGDVEYGKYKEKVLRQTRASGDHFLYSAALFYFEGDGKLHRVSTDSLEHDIFGIFYLLLAGIKHQSKESLYFALDLASRISNSVAMWGKLVTRLWVKESEYKPEWTSRLLGLLAKSRKEQQQQSEMDQELYMQLLDEAIDWSDASIQWIENSDQLETVHSGQVGKLAYCFTPYGMQSSLGGLKKEALEVVAMGPHMGPLNECQLFGIEREAPEWGSKEFPQSGKGFWTRAKTEVFDQLWVHLGLHEGDGLETDLSFQGAVGQTYSFTLFVKADLTEVGGQRLQKGSLNHFRGEAAWLTFSCKEELLRCQFDGKRRLTIMPLAGKEYFWGADFLVSISIEEDNSKIKITYS